MVLVFVLLGIFAIVVCLIFFEWMRLLAFGLAFLIALACLGG